LTAALANPARRPDRYALNQRRLADARVAAQQQTAVVAVRAECRTGSPPMRGPAADALPIAENYLIGARHGHRSLRPLPADVGDDTPGIGSSIMDAVTHASGVDQDFTDAAWPRQCELRPAGFMQALQVLMDRRIEHCSCSPAAQFGADCHNP